VADTRQRDVGELSQPEFNQAADGFVHKPMIAPIMADVKPPGVGGCVVVVRYGLSSF
jgi:hypothetical protein